MLYSNNRFEARDAVAVLVLVAMDGGVATGGNVVRERNRHERR